MRNPLFSLRQALLATAVIVVFTGCPEKTQSTVPPSGMAGSKSSGAANPSLGGHAKTPHVATAPSSQPTAVAPSSAPAPAAAPTVIRGDRPGAPSGKAAGHSGVVLESMNSGGYTYVKFKGDDGIGKWAAVTETKVAVGQKVNISESMVMKDFTSKTLKRTFKSIIFGNML
ncbi:MAG: hypothetical protein GY822_05170 [Deltaproteobacteria bacterium]|nr:hypothetical protein [Deltaproteobacteria bacterium]